MIDEKFITLHLKRNTTIVAILGLIKFYALNSHFWTKEKGNFAVRLVATTLFNGNDGVV